MSKKLDDKKLNDKAKKQDKPANPAQINTQADDDLLAVLGTLESEDNPWFSDMSMYSDPVLSKSEMTIGEKSAQGGGYELNNEHGERLDKTKKSDVLALSGILSKKDGHTNHYEGILGEFDYDTDEWAVCRKTLKDSEGHTSEIPVLRYIGNETNGDRIAIPDGVKSLDYTFEGNTKLETVPVIPDSVTSAHAAFMNCNNLKRACKGAKEGEREGGFDLAGWTAGGAAGGAATGTAIGAIPAVPTGGLSVPACAGIGAVIGGVGGAVKGTYEYVTGNGKGGTWKMPANLRDASSMFEGCESLEEGFESASDKLMLTRDMYAGNKNLGQDPIAMKYGSSAVTDFKSSKMLSKEAVENSYDGVNVDLLEDVTDNYSIGWDEASGMMNEADLSLEDKVLVENLSAGLKAKDVEAGVQETDISASTGGLASSATKRTKSGVTTTMDPNDKNTDVKAKTSEMANGAMGVLDRGLVSFGEFKLLKMVTGSTLLSAGIVFGGQMLGILPKSMKPVLNTVAGFVGDDNPVGSALNKIAEKLPDDGSESIFDDKSDKDIGGMAVRMQASMNDGLQTAASGSAQTIDTYMANNGKSVVENGTLLAVGKAGPGSQDIQEMSQIGLLAGGALEEKALSLEKDGKLSDEDKKALSKCVMTTASGLKAYQDSADRAIDQKYGLGSGNSDMAHEGLDSAMESISGPISESICELNAKYDFLSKDDRERLMNIMPGSVDTENVNDLDPDEAIYADAYLLDPIDDKGQATKSDKKESRKDAGNKNNKKTDKPKSDRRSVDDMNIRIDDKECEGLEL